MRQHMTTAAFTCESEFVHCPTLGSLESRLGEIRDRRIAAPILLLSLLDKFYILEPFVGENSSARVTPNINRHLDLLVLSSAPIFLVPF